LHRFEEYGRDDGYKDGYIQGQAEGVSIGLKNGFEIGRELGFYLGACETWLKVLSSNSEGVYPARYDIL
jgi:flagellar biosynthesis/type III secretory pathway protein FliH